MTAPAEPTFLDRALTALFDARHAVNQVLDSAGLDCIVDWFATKVIRQSDCPYAWIELGEWPNGERPAAPVGQPARPFAIPATVTVAFCGPSAEDLIRQVTQYLPRIMATMEGERKGLQVEVVDWLPLHEHRSEHFRLDAIRLLIRGERLPGTI